MSDSAEEQFAANTCAVCGGSVDDPIEHWGRIVCRECADKPVLFAASCNRGDCRWTTTEDGVEYRKGGVRQAIQREANNHMTRMEIMDEEEHETEWWEMEHPEREEGYLDG